MIKYKYLVYTKYYFFEFSSNIACRLCTMLIKIVISSMIFVGKAMRFLLISVLLAVHFLCSHVNVYAAGRSEQEITIIYQHIQNLLDKYQRPITVLALGTHNGDFAFRIAQNYDATCVMLSRDSNNRIYDRCRDNSDVNGLIFLNTKLIFGTVASEYANRIFAPCLMTPLCSWSVPGR